MSAGTEEDSEDPEAEATREDTLDLGPEIEGIEADPDPIEGIILVMRAALNAVRQDISRGTVQK